MEERKREGKGLQLTRSERCKTQTREGEGIDHGIARITRTHSRVCVYTPIIVCSGEIKKSEIRRGKRGVRTQAVGKEQMGLGIKPCKNQLC